MSFVVRVPASTANLGSGFDALGMALTIYAEFGVVGPGGDVPANARTVDLHHPAVVAFRRGGGIGDLWVQSPIPSGRGLGFSGAMRVGGLLAAAAQQHQWVEAAPDILALATELEGHADNAAASLLGGVVVAAGGRAVRVPMVLQPAVVVWIPAASTSTDTSRGMLPTTVAFEDAVFNVGRVALLVAAFAAGDVDVLRLATDDRLHQDMRFGSAPHSRAALDAALAAGAWAGWLSGSGPTVAALCHPDDAAALVAAFPVGGHAKVLGIDATGAHITR